MPSRAPFRLVSPSFAALGALVAACNAGPKPRDASEPPSVVIHNTAAVVQNQHVVSDVNPSPAVLALLAAPDRDSRDRRIDSRYQAADLLTFLDVRPGMHVAELTAGGGYATELFARAVGPGGEVLANDPPSLLARSGAAVFHALTERLSRPANAHVVRLDRDLASPLPDRARDLDLVYLSLPYRSAEGLGVPTKAMNDAVFAALKPGGRYVVLDYRPRMSGPSRINLHALHQQEATSVRRQVEAAGFDFLTEGRFLHNDALSTEWDAIDAPDPTALEVQDRFLLAFVKP